MSWQEGAFDRNSGATCLELVLDRNHTCLPSIEPHVAKNYLGSH